LTSVSIDSMCHISIWPVRTLPSMKKSLALHTVLHPNSYCSQTLHVAAPPPAYAPAAAAAARTLELPWLAFVHRRSRARGRRQ
jgi:hypothetical protein